MPNQVKFLPHNIQEHDNAMRALIASHMGTTGGNPTQWVVDAVHEAFARGFSLGFTTGQGATVSRPPAPEVPAIERPKGMPSRYATGGLLGGDVIDMEK
jgi:hypothetical protein